MRTRKGYKPCPKCNGTGEVKDAAETGRQMRALRKAAGKGLRQIAGAMNFSPAYVSDLELGRRGWSDSLVEQYKKAVRA
jgi:predicted transcriptional regulator